MAQEALVRLLDSQRRRLTASILGYAEREVYPSLPPAAQKAFRQKVLDAVGAYHDVMLDVLGASSEPGLLVNADALELLRDIRTQVHALRAVS